MSRAVPKGGELKVRKVDVEYCKIYSIQFYQKNIQQKTDVLLSAISGCEFIFLTGWEPVTLLRLLHVLNETIVNG